MEIVKLGRLAHPTRLLRDTNPVILVPKPGDFHRKTRLLPFANPVSVNRTTYSVHYRQPDTMNGKPDSLPRNPGFFAPDTGRHCKQPPDVPGKAFTELIIHKSGLDKIKVTPSPESLQINRPVLSDSSPDTTF